GGSLIVKITVWFTGIVVPLIAVIWKLSLYWPPEPCAGIDPPTLGGLKLNAGKNCMPGGGVLVSWRSPTLVFTFECRKKPMLSPAVTVGSGSKICGFESRKNWKLLVSHARS